jgi:general secretion pathway protein G
VKLPAADYHRRMQMLSLRKKRNRDAQEGFTLIEVIVAIAIGAIFLGVVAPNVMKWWRSAKVSGAKSQLRAFESSIAAYNLDTNTSPETLRDLVQPPADELLRSKWQGPYLKKKEIPLDPWGAKYQYKPTPNAEHDYELYSYGPKGRSAPKAEWISVHKI